MSSASQNPFDRASRGIVRRAGPAKLAWLLGVPAASLRFDRWLDTHLSVPGQPGRVCDLVAHTRRTDQEFVPWGIPSKFQVAPDRLMFGRLMVYEGMIWLQEKPPLSGDHFNLQSPVVNLTGVGRSGRVMEWKAGLGTTLAPVEWDLETLDADVTLEQIASGEAPRLAGVDTDRRREGLEESLEGFNVIESAIVNEWKAEATIKSKIDDLVKLVEAKFGPVPDDAKAKIESTNSPALLQQWILLAGKANSLDEFRCDAGV